MLHLALNSPNYRLSQPKRLLLVEDQQVSQDHFAERFTWGPNFTVIGDASKATMRQEICSNRTLSPFVESRSFLL